MRSNIQQRLLSLNREFYQTFAVDFAESRHSPQPGVPRLLKRVEAEQAVLDLGCGNGSLAAALHEQGHRGTYIGLDNSPALLEWAREQTEHPQARFILGDLAETGWSEEIEGRDFPWIFSLAVIHHLPGKERRRRFAQELEPLIAQDGKIVISVWNFPAEPRFRDRILPWTTLGLSETDVDAGDALLDWRRGGRGLRYVHHFDQEELEELAAAAGCQVSEEHKAGGSSDELNWVQIWQPI